MEAQFDTCPNCGPRSFLSRSSPFQAHLGTCIAFDTPEPDRRAILESVHNVEQDMALCRERIAHLTAVLADAQDQLDSLEVLRRTHIELFPPVHTLPVEISLKIFELVVKKPYPYNSIQDGPWRLGHVCRLWRQITSAPSSLWKSLSFRAYMPGSCSIPMLRTVFERSSPLSFDAELIGDFIDIVKSHSLRWYDIAMDGTPESYRQLGELGELPLLVTASLATYSTEGIASCSLVETLDIFRDAPRLKSIKLHGVFPMEGLNLQLSAFPWRQLTCLYIALITTSFIDDCQLLTHCPNLHSYFTYTMREPGPSELVSHSKLKSLTVDHIGLLRYLRCMSLTELVFSTVWIPLTPITIERYMSALRSFVAQSPVLAYVDIILKDGNVPISFFFSSFTSVSIRTFKLNVEGASGDFVPLTASAMPLLLPQMTHFECTITRSANDLRFVESLGQVIQSRWHSETSNIARLQSVRISISQRVYNAAKEELCRMIDCLRVLKAEGLDVAVSKFWDQNDDTFYDHIL